MKYALILSITLTIAACGTQTPSAPKDPCNGRQAIVAMDKEFCCMTLSEASQSGEMFQAVTLADGTSCVYIYK